MYAVAVDISRGYYSNQRGSEKVITGAANNSRWPIGHPTFRKLYRNMLLGPLEMPRFKR